MKKADEAAETEAPETEAGPVNDMTDIVVNDATQLAPELAWSQDEPDTEPEPHVHRHQWSRAWGIAAILLVIGGLVGTFIWMAIPILSAPPKAAPGPVLDGTYRYDFNFEKQTIKGLPNPPPEGKPKSQTLWGAARSTCTQNGCTATTTALDDKNHDTAYTPLTTHEWHFVNGRWETTPNRDREKIEWCTGDNEDKKVAGEQTVSFSRWIEPQPDGTLRGVLSKTVVSNECNFTGNVVDTPFTMTRIGDVSSKVIMADPSKIPWPSVVPPIPGPVFNGTYRIDYDDLHATLSGGAYPNAPTNNTTASNSVRWVASKSTCTPVGCVAVIIDLDETNHQEPDGIAADIKVFHFVNGHWVTGWDGKLKCALLGRGNKNVGVQTVRRSLDLEPQPDGTLKGVAQAAINTDECGTQGVVATTPVIITRTGPASPNVVLPDPALFA